MANAEEQPSSWSRRRYQLERPSVVVVSTTMAALLGGVLLGLATNRSDPLLGLVGVGGATVAAWVITDYSDARWRAPNSRGWQIFVTITAMLGAVGLLVADANRSQLGAWAPGLAFASLMALTLAIGPLVGLVRGFSGSAADVWMIDGLVVGFMSAIVIGSSLPTPLRMLAAVALLGGLGVFTVGVSIMCTQRPLPTSRLLKIIPGDARERGLGVGGVGLGCVVLGLIVVRMEVMAVGVWLTVVAMIMLSVRPARFEMSMLMARSVLGAGALLVLVAGYQLYASDMVGRSRLFVTFLAATIALLGAWIVWRGATLFIVVLLGFGFVWGLVPRAAAVEVDATPSVAGTAGIVAFGDSFISGEGASEFYAGTDQKGADRNECRRAPTAYPVLLADRLGTDLDFHACSGAKLGDVVVLCDNAPEVPVAKGTVRSSGYETDDGSSLPTPAAPLTEAESEERCVNLAKDRSEVRRSELRCDVGAEGLLGQYPCSADGVRGATLQVEQLAEQADSTKLVLLSIGGNDVRFGDIVAGCLLPGSCAERREVWLDNVAALGPELTEGYDKIKAEFGGSVPIVVMPYPLVLTEETCESSPLDESEHEFIFEFTTVLNRQIAASAELAGVHYFDRGAFALEGRRLCETGQRAINMIRLQPTDGPLLDRLNPGSWTHNSMHPNKRGHAMIATALAGWLDEKKILEREPGMENPSPTDAADARLLDVRTARPHAVSSSVADQLRSNPPSGCDVASIGSFATRIEVFDEQPPDERDLQAFRVPVVGADPTSPICVTNRAGEWGTLPPPESEPHLAAASQMQLPSDPPLSDFIDDSVFLTGGRPDDRCTDRLEAAGATPRLVTDFCDFQWVLFAAPRDDPASPMIWSLRAVSYCSVDPGCEKTFEEWREVQIGRAVGRVSASVGLIILGGWLLALGIELVFAPRLGRLSRRPLSGSVVDPNQSK